MNMKHHIHPSRPVDTKSQFPFFVRDRALQEVLSHLYSESPLCCAIIGEMFTGKTSLLHHLESMLQKVGWACVYLNCKRYIDMSQKASYASNEFWTDLLEATKVAVHIPEDEKLAILAARGNEDDEDELLSTSPFINNAGKNRDKVKKLIQSCSGKVTIILDNFEGVGSLPLRDSNWLRELQQQHQKKCAFVISSRYLLHLTDHHDPEQVVSPSPLWNLFSDHIYLGLLDEDEAKQFLDQAQSIAKALGQTWDTADMDYIRRIAGRHPKLLQIACHRLFKKRQQSSQHDRESLKFLEYEIYEDALSVCDTLWHNLADPELQEKHRSGGFQAAQENRLSPHQQVMLAIARNYSLEDITIDPQYAFTRDRILFTLKQRGFIEEEQHSGRCYVFSTLMQQFILEQAYNYQEYPFIRQKIRSAEKEADAKSETQDMPQHFDFTKLEGLVYDYLKMHLGTICSHEKIKQTVWKNAFPSDSALQKIIERIRAKIEPDPEEPYYLVAVRGQGYMLRSLVPSHSKRYS